MKTTRDELLTALQFFFPQTFDSDCLLVVSLNATTLAFALPDVDHEQNETFETSDVLHQFATPNHVYFDLTVQVINLDNTLRLYNELRDASAALFTNESVKRNERKNR